MVPFCQWCVKALKKVLLAKSWGATAPPPPPAPPGITPLHSKSVAYKSP